MPTKKDSVGVMIFPWFANHQQSKKQSKIWKLKDTGKEEEPMFALAFYISDRFRNRIALYEKGAFGWKYIVDNLILENLKFCFKRDYKGEVINIF